MIFDVQLLLVMLYFPGWPWGSQTGCGKPRARVVLIPHHLLGSSLAVSVKVPGLKLPGPLILSERTGT